jgi:hypothetical protein
VEEKKAKVVYASPNNFEIRNYVNIEKQEVLVTDLVSTE